MGGCLNPTPDPEWDPYPVWSIAQPLFQTLQPSGSSLGVPTLHAAVPFLDRRIHSLCTDLESLGLVRLGPRGQGSAFVLQCQRF